MNSLAERYVTRVREANNGKLICDGCNVKPPFEHRCHGDNSQVSGEPTRLSCECDECRAPTPEELNLFRAELQGCGN